MTLRQVARRTRLSNAYLSQMENGYVLSPSPHDLRKLARAYDVPYCSIMRAAGYLEDDEHILPSNLAHCTEVGLTRSRKRSK